MSGKITLGTLLSALISEPVEVIKIFLILTLGELGRWLYGGGRIREMAGDLIISLLLFYLIRPHIIQLSEMIGTKVSSGAIAICIALIGSHGISQILIYAIKKRTGVDIAKFLFRNKH
ncbi:Uncharacterised protein [Lelliottia amnigena]|uniref:hypothetical protein n=1 Tax=Lelliottia TaxID=1330545 RepID=UPI0007436750|nr:MULTISPECIES: hypothetical protein [Lelliottia]ATG02896.1 hypothetical protein CO697_15500 [Lelliottia amnigena]QXA23191.1 hypothetical protein I6L74_07160 [Lelliottia amnigena]CAI9418098.1 hypothetical protein CCAJJPOJ_03441 [Lelliottia sp. T2.26D-8]VDZ91098.1 Uncharacterised protein [Lelliottia amnigena]